jgi:hypothetical protein
LPRGVALKTIVLIDAATDILAEIQPASVRAVCYQLFNRKLISDMGKNETARVSRILTRAREDGVISWDAIIDETREVELVPSWADPERYMDVVIRSYRRNRWADQPRRLMVVSEKGTVGGTLRPIIHEYGIPFQVYHGFGSATALHDLAERSVQDNRQLTLLYVGDHDPSGRYMSDSDLPDRITRYGGNAWIERVAVTAEQIADHDLPTFTAAEKTKDARHAWFVKEHGETCCELDALNPNVLRTMVEQAIRSHLDQDAWYRADVTEHAEIASLTDFFQSWPGVGQSA